MRNALQRFMYGRYGNDQLNTALVVLYLVLWLLEIVTHISFFGVLSTVLVFVVLFRMLSRNLYKRREENGKYIRARYKVSARLKLKKEQWVQRKDYKFFTCPSCKTTLRVPRGHGKLKIVCRKCGNSFTGKS